MLYQLHHVSNKNGSQKGSKRKQGRFTVIDSSKGTVLTNNLNPDQHPNYFT